jgi:hypothetical protein
VEFEPEKEVTALSVVFGVYHADSDTSRTGQHAFTNPDDGKSITVNQYDADHADKDGHRIMWSIGRDAEFRLAYISFRQGTDPRYAANLLRKLADLVEKNPKVLHQSGNSLGEFRSEKAIKLKPDGSGWEELT